MTGKHLKVQLNQPLFTRHNERLCKMFKVKLNNNYNAGDVASISKLNKKSRGNLHLLAIVKAFQDLG